MKRALTTIVTRSYLAHARLLATEYRRHHPDGRCIVLVADADVDDALTDQPFEVLRLADLGAPEVVREMTFIYTPFELSCALRGLFHRTLLERDDLDSWLFVDGDVFIVGDLTPVFEEIESRSITLSRHARTPAFPDHRPTPEVELLNCGLFNGGVLGVRRDENALEFAEWLHSRLLRHALVDPPMFVDQLWLNLVPEYFDGVGIFAHPGINVGHWNLHERTLARATDGSIQVDGAPLLLAHLSGVDRAAPDRVSVHAPWWDGRAPEPWQELIERYFRGLDEHGLEAARGVPYGFARYHDGRSISLADRRAYRAALLSGRAGSGDPFGERVQLLERLRHFFRRSLRRARGLPPIERA